MPGMEGVPGFWRPLGKSFVDLPGWRFFWLVVTGTWILFFHIFGIISPIDSYFSEGLKPPTSFVSKLLPLPAICRCNRSKRSSPWSAADLVDLVPSLFAAALWCLVALTWGVLIKNGRRKLQIHDQGRWERIVFLYPLVMTNNSFRKSPISMGKSTISMAIFQFAFCLFTRYLKPDLFRLKRRHSAWLHADYAGDAGGSGMSIAKKICRLYRLYRGYRGILYDLIMLFCEVKMLGCNESNMGYQHNDWRRFKRQFHFVYQGHYQGHLKSLK